MSDEVAKRRPILGLLAVFVLFLAYRFFAVYTVRVGECTPKPVDPSLRTATRNEAGHIVTFPIRDGYPPQSRPLVILTYNIEGHDELYDGAHAAKIAETIRQLKPDIVGLQEVHRKTWQVRFRDQFAEIQKATGMHGYYAPSYKSLGGEFGNAILTRGDIVSATIHPLPSVGEPRSVVESVIRIDGVLLNVYVTHLTAWGSLKSRDRAVQLDCLAKHVRTSRYPFIVLGDFNAPPEYDEVARFDRLNTAQMAGRDILITHPMMHRRIDYIFADYGWQIVSARAVPTGSSDHYPVVAEMFWSRS